MMAQKYLKEALEIAPNDPFVLHELGVIAFQSHRYVKYLNNACLLIRFKFILVILIQMYTYYNYFSFIPLFLIS